jgi:hypothetical protein
MMRDNQEDEHGWEERRRGECWSSHAIKYNLWPHGIRFLFPGNDVFREPQCVIALMMQHTEVRLHIQGTQAKVGLVSLVCGKAANRQQQAGHELPPQLVR